MGRHVEPWWTIKWMPPHPQGARIWHLKIGPVSFCASKLGRARHVHFYAPRWVGTQVTTWMDGDCF